MRVAHILLDGYCPDNLTRGRFDIDKIIESSDLFKSYNKCTKIITNSDHEMHSHQLWGGLYSGISYDELSKVVGTTGSMDSRHAKLNKDVWIWNALSNLEVPSYLGLSYTFRKLSEFNKYVSGKISIDEDSSISKTGRVLDIQNGKSSIIKDNIVDSWIFVDKKFEGREELDAFNAQCWYEKKVPEACKIFEYKYKNLILDKIESNYEWYDKLINKGLKFGEDKKDFYFTVQIMETDMMYHLYQEYKDIVDAYSNMLTGIFNSISDKFDVVIIGGDHGMIDYNYKKKSGAIDVMYNGYEFKTIKPSIACTPTYSTDHDRRQGAIILSRKELGISVPDNYDRLAGDFIRNWIIDNIKA